ncbi:MAG: diguanylate cyclase [Haliea sp.]|nr:diguanylate cyclase [Haliea sp.]|tara:strand:+ start:190722 stop:193991 length:3270 start_codon:yes stop_codon:yes gene_type:complete
MFAQVFRHLRLLALPGVLALAVLSAGVAVTLIYQDVVRDREEAALQQAFRASADRAAALIQREFGVYKAVMRGLQGFFQGSSSVSFKEYLNYVRSLRLHTDLSALRAVGWVPWLSREEVPRYLARLHYEVAGEHRIYPDTGAEHLAPITYIYPLDTDNRHAIGFDVLSNSGARTAALAARDSGEMHISEPTTLIQDVNKPAKAFVMYLPVYRGGAVPPSVAERRQRLLGWVDVPLRVEDFFAGLAAELDPAVRLRLYDGVPGEGSAPMIHDTHPAAGQPASLSHRYDLSIGGRTWMLEACATGGFRASLGVLPPSRMVMASGLLLSLAGALLVFVIARSRDRSARRALRLEDLYHALSEVNQAIVRMGHEQDLFPLVCRMAVDYGGMDMAWVGRLNPVSGRVEPAAAWGDTQDYLAGVDISVDAELPSGRGPCGTAVRESRPVVVNDYFDVSSTQPWHRRVREAGWKSAAAFPILRGGRPHAVLNVYHRKAGAFDDHATRLLAEMSTDIGFALDNFDRETERAHIQAALRESEARLSTILENVGACIYLKDTGGRYLYANQQVKDLWGVGSGDVVGQTDEAFFDAATVKRLRENDRRVLEDGETLELEEVDTVKGEEGPRVFWSVKLPMRREDGSIYALCGISTDITEHKRNREQIDFLTHYDALTGLPNMSLLRERARQALAQAAASGQPLTLLCIDLDRFKNVNDSLGLDMGDQVIQGLAKRLLERLHLSASLCRSGGDEFFVLVPGAGTLEAERLARHLLREVARPLELRGQRFTLTASIGVACFPQHGSNFDELNQAADAALFEAKHAGRNTFALFTSSMRDQATRALRLETELRDAMALGQLELHYQPQVDIHSGELLGLEALLRWRHPESGYIPPSRFIPVAEESGLISELDAWVMRTALAQQAAWRAAGFRIPTVSVNVSATRFYRTDFCDQVAALLKEYWVAPECLDLELTERIAMVHSSATLNTLTRLHDMGLTLSIDDFGTGYSSLSYLKRYPVSKLKIDKSFVDGLADDPEDQAIVLAIIGVARGLGFKTVAEGVETEQQLAFLREHGCDAYQGYLYSRPQAAEVIEPLLTRASEEHG